MAVGKYRYQLQKEIRDKKERQKEIEKTGVGGTVPLEEKTQEEIEIEEMQEAELRQVFNPIEKTYDARKMRVTDLEINSRVTLPKGLPSN